MIRPAAALALFVALATTTATAEDLTISFKSGDGGVATHYFTKDRVRMNSGKTDTMMEFASGKIVSIDHKKKEYFEMTIAELDATMKGVAAQMEEAMANVPPQMRGQMAKMMGGGASEVTVTKGATKTIAGYPCQTYTVSMGTTMTRETCNSTALTPPFDPAHFEKMSRVSIPMIQGMDKMIKKMSEIQGIALMERTSTSMMGRKSDTSMEATAVGKSAIAADVFAMPAGYKRIDSPLKNLKMGR
jgi:hypothetical protein